MRARFFLLWILLFLTTSFFREDEEKQLRQLHQSGEAALQKGDFEKAQDVFTQLLDRVSVNTSHASSQKYAVDWSTYVDVATCLAASYEGLQKKKEAETVLIQLLAKKPPAEFIPRVTLMKARLTAMQESPANAYAEMSALATKCQITHWTAKDLSFFYALEDSLNTYYDELIAKAKRHLLAGMYSEAITMYEEILTAIEKGSYPKVKNHDGLVVKKIKYRLAECHFLAADYEKTLFFCRQIGDECVKDASIDREMLFLSAQCYREKREYEKALELLQNYTHLGDACDLEHYEQALFEIGSLYYQIGQTAQASRYFQKLQSIPGRPRQLAALYLSRVYLDEKKAEAVDPLLTALKDEFQETSLFRAEFYYLRGVAAFNLKKFSSAKELFEKVFEEKGGNCWRNAMYYLGWCYTRLGDDFLKSESERLRLFCKAEELFQKISDEETARLAIAQHYLIRFKHFPNKELLDKVEEWLVYKRFDFSPEGEIQALLLRAEAQQSYLAKEQLYAQATDPKFINCCCYADAWYGRGINYFKEALKDPKDPLNYFEHARQALEKAFNCSNNTNPQKAAHILKLEAKATMYCHADFASLALLEKLLTQYEENLTEKEETLYLRGLIASRVDGPTYFSLAEESFQQAIQGYPLGKYKESASYALATLYYRNGNYEKAKQTFLQLAQEQPDSTFAPESLFWAAEASALLHEDPLAYRKQIYEKYPASPFAPQAFFHQFPLTAYYEGSQEAICHLKQFVMRFQGSPLQIAAHYFLGLHASNLDVAKIAFETALAEFESLQQKGKVADHSQIYFRYHALLKLAEIYLNGHSVEDLAYCEKLLSSYVEDFEQSHHPLTHVLKQNSPYPYIFEEGEFKLAQCYLHQGKQLQAQNLFSKMLAHYKASGIQESPLLSQVWMEMGKLSLECEEYETALNCFLLSQECGMRFMTDEQKLSLWLLQSDAYRGKKEYDMAMRLLSRVINEETASTLRLKAMFLRSEIYELEGRRELAIRQLEATAKKGGEWAMKAQEKLKAHYGYQ